MLAKINIILKWGIVIGLIALAILSLIYKYDSCNKCSFEYNGLKLNAKEFMKIYYHECLELKQNKEILNISMNPSFHSTIP